MLKTVKINGNIIQRYSIANLINEFGVYEQFENFLITFKFFPKKENVYHEK